MKKNRIYTCTNCKETGEVIGVAQTELNYYSMNLNTNQWEDFHGDGDVKSQRLFCVHCNKNMDLVSQIDLFH